MENENAERIIELLESIENKLDSIHYAIGSVKSECEDISSKANKLREIEDAVDRIRKNM
jgi:archaellum component FlaC